MNQWNETDWPQFLIGDSPDERTFVVHLHHPRFVGEVEENDDGTESIRPTFIDDIDGMDAAAIARLMREAGDFYVGEIEREL